MIARTFEEIEKIVSRKKYYLLETYIDDKRNSLRKIIIQDKNGYKYDISLNDFIRDGICFASRYNPYVLDNISLWFKLHKKPFEVCEKTSYIGADKKIVFYCQKCDNDFTTTWAHIQGGRGCGVCKGFQVGWNTSLEYLRPDLAIEWDVSNKILANEVTLKSNKKVKWKCQKEECGYIWKTTVNARVDGKKGLGCPSCYGRVVSDRNRLSILFPIVYGQWHPTKNKKINPYNLSFGTPNKYWWLCNKCGNDFYSAVSSRTKRGRGCPKCKESKGEKKIQEVLLSFGLITNEDFKSQHRIKNCRNIKPLPFDFCVFENGSSNKILFMIEYNGIQHYEVSKTKFFGGKIKLNKRQKLDKIKQDYCQKNNISLLIIPYTEFDKIEKILKDKFLELS